MKILVTGSSGQVGQELAQLAHSRPDWRFFFHDSDTLDISQHPAVEAAFAEIRPDWCINAAAYTAVDKAESEPDRAESVNALGATYLAQACQTHGARLLHYSTDYVHHHLQNHAYSETDPTHPHSVYARTKLAGEQGIERHCAQHLILRTSWVYSRFGQNFVKTMIRLGETRPELGVVSDQIGSPTYARDLAEASLQLISYIQENQDFSDWGIYNYSNEGVCSWYDFAHAIFELRGLRPTLRPIRTEQYPTPAHRPPFSLLDKHKLKTRFGLPIRHWRDALAECLQGL